MNSPPCAFTVDVEDYFQVDAFSRVIDPSDWDGFGSRVVANTGRLLDLLDQHQVRGTFFVLGWIAARHPDLVRLIVARGHELASHGMSHQRIVTQTPAVFRQETRDSKRLLEDLGQVPVTGYRAATYSITRASLWALDVLKEEGFEYDSSIFPVRHDRYGIPDARTVPHRLTTPGGQTLVEYPLTAVDVLGLNIPMAGGGYFRLFPYGVTRWGLRRAQTQGRPVVFYLHPWEVDPEQPRIRNAALLSRFRHYLNLDRTLPRLDRLLSDFRFCTMRECLEAEGLL
ncbi:MAG: DUF3473 domain-containing protein [Gammaproteobacteria bacterium]